MKAILEFNLPDDQMEFNRVNQSLDMACALFDILQLRKSLERIFENSHNTNNDVLKIQVSTDCGGLWTNLATLSSSQLAAGSGGINPNPFFPSITAEWKTYNISEHPFWPNYINSQSLLVRFNFQQGSAGVRNNFFIDAASFGAQDVGINQLTKSVNLSFSIDDNVSWASADPNFSRNDEGDAQGYPTVIDVSFGMKIIENPSVVDSKKSAGVRVYKYNFDGLETQMEGKFRPGHFEGVGTIVKRLFEIVKPTNAYFGEKDFQQLQIIKKLVEKENFPINIVGCPIIREENGLAMSSRNERLSPTERNLAAFIYKTLLEVKNKFSTESLSEITLWVNQVFESQPDFKLDYFEIADEATLQTCETKNQDQKCRVFIAVFVNNIRLIDTISLN